MMILDAPLEPAVRVQMREKVREVRGSRRNGNEGPPRSWIEISPVTSIALSAKMTEDKELANFIESQKATYRYDWVRLFCSFFPEQGETFEKAWLNVDLSANGAAQPDALPIAWSVTPETQYDSVQRTLSATLGSELKFTPAKVTAGLSGQETAALKRYFIRSYSVGGAKPFWEMAHTDLASINGSFAFHLVIRSSRATETKGVVKLSAVIGARTFLVFRSERAHADEPVQEFLLRPAATSSGGRRRG